MRIKRLHIISFFIFLCLGTVGEAVGQVRFTKRLTLGKMRDMSRDAGSSVGEVAKEEAQSYQTGARAEYLKLKKDLPGKAWEFATTAGDTNPRLKTLILDENVRRSIEDRRNKKRFVELAQEWWLLPTDDAIRERLEQLKRLRFNASLDSSKYRIPKVIRTPNGLERTMMFGWHTTYAETPDRKSAAYKGYDYQRLAYISYYSYDVDPTTGTPLDTSVVKEFMEGDFIKTVRDKKNMRLYPDPNDETAQKIDTSYCKVLLSVSLHGEYNQITFLNATNINAQQTLIDSLINILAITQADGLELNFLGVPANMRGEFSTFVKKLAQSIRATNPRYVLFMSVPAYDPANVYDLRSFMDDYDYFLIQGYNFHLKPEGMERTPMSQLNYNASDQSYDIRAAVEKNIVEVGPFNAYRLILALTFRGTQWITTGTEQKFIDEKAYWEIMALYPPDSLHYRYDVGRGTYIWTALDSTNKLEMPIQMDIYYDDTLSLNRKFQFVNQNRLGGVGMWALNDAGQFGTEGSHIQQLLVENFTEFKAPPNKYKDKAKKVSETSQEYGVRTLAVLMYWSIFAILGFVLSLFSVQTRQALFDNPRFRTLYLSFFMILLVLLGYYFSLFQYNILLLIFGLLLGSGISWGLLKALYKQQEEQP